MFHTGSHYRVTDRNQGRSALGSEFVMVSMMSKITT
jgi:hypothetical protein